MNLADHVQIDFAVATDLLRRVEGGDARKCNLDHVTRPERLRVGHGNGGGDTGPRGGPAAGEQEACGGKSDNRESEGAQRRRTGNEIPAP